MRFSHALTEQLTSCRVGVPAYATADVTSPKSGSWSGVKRDLNRICLEAPPPVN